MEYVGAPGATVIERDLTGGLEIITLVYPPGYASIAIVVSVNSAPCLSEFFSPNDALFTVSGKCRDGGNLSLDFRYIPPTDPCEPGGLYLMEGILEPPGGAAPLNYRNIELAAWDEEGNPLNPSFRPFQGPTLLSQASQADWAPDKPLDTLGSWTYTVEFASPGGALPTGCSLDTGVDLTLSPAAENSSPRVYHYVVAETGAGEETLVTISPPAENAPAASIEFVEDASLGKRKRLSFTGLDALRDNKAQISLEFTQPIQVVPGQTTMDPLSALVAVDRDVEIASGSPPGPLAGLLAGFFTTLTAPLTAAYGFPAPTLYVQITAYLSTPLGDGTQATTPLALLPYQSYTPGFDDKSDCAALPDPGLVCKLAAAVTAAASPAPSASYVFDISFMDANGSGQPLFRVARAVLPVSKISQ